MNGFQIGIPKRESLPKTLRFLSFHSAQTCTTIRLAWTLPPCDAMPSNRPNLILDEQSFQGLLSAAFIIQEHNERVRQARQTHAEPEAQLEPETQAVCPHCGAPKPAEESRCQLCGQDEFRPGERLQRNWASMWLMSQEQRLWPERFLQVGEAALEAREAAGKAVPPPESERSPRAQAARAFAASGFPALPLVRNEVARETIDASVLDRAAEETAWTTAATDDFTQDGLTQEDLTQEDFTQEDSAPEDSDLTVQPYQLSASDDSSPADASADKTTGASSLIQRLADFRVKLRFHRADLYLGVAVFISALALMWPAASTPQRAALGPWERALVELGIAEAPAPTIHTPGDPGIQVWVDPHTALYYCPGEEQYGKTADGRVATQRDAQMDRFQPAGRSVCE
jgi:hypothetical protein